MVLQIVACMACGEAIDTILELFFSFAGNSEPLVFFPGVSMVSQADSEHRRRTKVLRLVSGPSGVVWPCVSSFVR